MGMVGKGGEGAEGQGVHEGRGNGGRRATRKDRKNAGFGRCGCAYCWKLGLFIPLPILGLDRFYSIAADAHVESADGC